MGACDIRGQEGYSRQERKGWEVGEVGGNLQQAIALGSKIWELFLLKTPGVWDFQTFCAHCSHPKSYRPLGLLNYKTGDQILASWKTWTSEHDIIKYHVHKNFEFWAQNQFSKRKIIITTTIIIMIIMHIFHVNMIKST